MSTSYLPNSFNTKTYVLNAPAALDSFGESPNYQNMPDYAAQCKELCGLTGL